MKLGTSDLKTEFISFKEEKVGEGEKEEEKKIRTKPKEEERPFSTS